MKTSVRWFLIILIGGFFLLAGLGKLAEPDAFAQSILRYRLVSSPLAALAALWLPWSEVVWALGLIMPRLRLAATWLLFGLLCFFQVALFSALVRGLDINCGCLGTIGESGVSMALLRNCGLMVGLAVIAWLEKRSQ
ncbi:MAG: MauE/DoxX family redox-associated membrane protein [Puniceicoccaceae bacterium]